MALTSDEIKEIEKLAANLEKWANNLSYSPPSPTMIRLLPDVGQDKVILCLLAEMTAVGRKVEKDFKVLYEMHDDVYSWRGKAITEDEWPEFAAQVDTLKGAAYGLVGTLRQIAQKATEKLETEKPAGTERYIAPAKRERESWLWRLWSCVKRIPRWICGLVVAVFVALIAAIVVRIFAEFGWLDRIKAFIEKIVWPE